LIFDGGCVFEIAFSVFEHPDLIFEFIDDFQLGFPLSREGNRVSIFVLPRGDESLAKGINE